MKWNSKKQLQELICELVGWDSRTGTKGEVGFAANIKEKMMELDYFQSHPQQIQFHDAGKGRHTVSALYKKKNIQKTVLLISHYVTIHNEEYWVIGGYAFSPYVITDRFQE